MIPFGRVDEDWSSDLVYLIGGGPSITDFPVDKLQGITLGANKSAFRFNCDMMASLDRNFVNNYTKEITEFVGKGKKVFLCYPPNDRVHIPIPGVTYLLKEHSDGLSEKPEAVYGVHTGYVCLNIAFLAKAKRIALLGFDMQYSKSGKSHCHEGYTWQNLQTPKYYDQWSRNFAAAASQLKEAGAEVINFVGPEGSLITEFPKLPLEQLL